MYSLTFFNVFDEDVLSPFWENIIRIPDRHIKFGKQIPHTKNTLMNFEVRGHTGQGLITGTWDMEWYCLIYMFRNFYLLHKYPWMEYVRWSILVIIMSYVWYTIFRQRLKAGDALHTQEQNFTPFSWWCFAIQRE